MSAAAVPLLSPRRVQILLRLARARELRHEIQLRGRKEVADNKAAGARASDGNEVSSSLLSGGSFLRRGESSGWA